VADPLSHPPEHIPPGVDADPVPEPLRPTPARLAYWTVAALAMFVVIGGLFMLAEYMQNSAPSVAPPTAQHASPPKQAGDQRQPS